MLRGILRGKGPQGFGNQLGNDVGLEPDLLPLQFPKPRYFLILSCSDSYTLLSTLFFYSPFITASLGLLVLLLSWAPPGGPS